MGVAWPNKGYFLICGHAKALPFESLSLRNTSKSRASGSAFFVYKPLGNFVSVGGLYTKKCVGRRPTWLLRGVARASAASGREKADEIRLIPLPVGVPRELCFRRGLYTKKCVGRRPTWLLRGVARASVASGREKADEIRLIPFAVGVLRELRSRRGLYTKKCVGRRPTWLLRGVARACAASGREKACKNRTNGRNNQVCLLPFAL